MKLIPIIHRPQTWWALWFGEPRRGGGFVIYGTPAWPSYSVSIIY